VTADGQSAGSKDEVCQVPDPGVPVVSISLACGTAFSAVTGNLPVSIGGGRVAGVGIGIADELATTPLGDVATELNTTVDGLLGQLEPVFTAIEPTGLQAGTLLETLLDEILGGNGNLVTVTVGKADTITESLADKVTSRSTANGSTITVLDRPILGPVLTITVGKAETFVSRATADGAAVATYSPAIVSVDIADDIHALLPAATPSLVEVTPGQTVCLPLPSPLESCIIVGDGSVSEAGAETTTAKAAGVSLELLKGLPEGGITLALAQANSAVGANLADEQRTADIPAPAAPQLPRTGGQMPLAAMLGLAAAATGGLALVRRSRAVTA
jgi:LPXTG-motif cell wall-anchored protein